MAPVGDLVVHTAILGHQMEKHVLTGQKMHQMLALGNIPLSIIVALKSAPALRGQLPKGFSVYAMGLTHMVFLLELLVLGVNRVRVIGHV
ncbi:hypothetical protein CGK17_23060 [Vibrio parahaemolyticus]|nr:hypothetical protein CGK17_23060 [Vibrio parahaemolyticus]